jgi:hypothetical protein
MHFLFRRAPGGETQAKGRENARRLTLVPARSKTAPANRRKRKTMLNEIPKPLLKRFIIATIVFAPVVGLTYYDAGVKKPTKPVTDTLKVYRRHPQPESNPLSAPSPKKLFVQDRCFRIEAP